MTALQVVALALVVAGAVAVVLVRETVRLMLVNSIYALFLVVLFLVFQAPDVALSELVVGAVAFPLVLILALTKERE